MGLSGLLCSSLLPDHFATPDQNQLKHIGPLMKLYIIQQFIADTMCQPTTILNSYKTLVVPKLTVRAFFHVHHEKWETLINITPGIYSQLRGGGSDLGLRKPDGRELIFSLLRNAFQIFSTRQHKFTVERITISKFRRKTNFNKSVVFFRIHDDDDGDIKNEFKGHFFCAVDYDKKKCIAAVLSSYLRWI